MKKTILLFACVPLLFTVTAAQKPWAEWTKDEVDKMLNKSAWGHVVTSTDTSEMNVTMGLPGQMNQSISWNYYVRFFSAKPIREAFARKVILDNPKLTPAQLERFVSGDYSDSIVVAVTFDAQDRRYMAQLEKAFNTSTTGLLQGKVYLELKDGKRLLMEEYMPPAKDGSGAKFVFPRSVDGKPFVTDEKDVLRFVAIMGYGVSMSYRFKLSDMIYGGKLEY